MRQVAPYSLWIGDAREGRDIRTLTTKGIRVIVQVDSEDPPILEPGQLVYLRFTLRNGEENTVDLLENAVGAVASLIEKGVPTLVFCGTGKSQAIVIVAAALAGKLHVDFSQCLVKVATGAVVRASPALLADVEKVVETRKEPREA